MAKLDLNDGQFRPSIDGIENGKTSQVTGMNRILNFIQGNINYLKSLVDSKANRTLNINAGKGLQGGGALSKDVTLNVVSVNDAIIVNDNDIQLNPVNDLTTGGTDKALSGEMGKKLNTDKQNKTDSGLQTNSKEIVGAINESLWHTKPKSVGNTSTQSDLNDLTDLGFYRSQSANNLWLNLPNNLTKASFFLEVIGGNVEYGVIHQIISFTVKNTRYIRWGTKNTSGMGKPNEWGEWQEILTSDSRLFLGNSGISKVVYIQDEGTKTQGQGYIDKSTGQVYLCLETNTDTTITNKFMSITNVELGKKIKQNTDDKVDKADIVDNLTTADKSKVLSANMGKHLNDNKFDKTGGVINGSISINTTDNVHSLAIVNPNLPARNNKMFLGFRNNIARIRLYGGSKEIRDNGFNIEANNDKILFRIDNNGDVFARGVDKALTENSHLFLGNSGIASIIYIQDAGEKTAGNGYVDKTTGQLYLCKTTNSDTSVTSNFVLATNIEIAKRQHFTKTILFDKPKGHGNGNITLSDNWENYDEFIVYGASDNVDYVGSHRFKKEDIEYVISKGQRYMIYGEANYYWIARITTGSKTWASGDKWENCAIFRIIGIKYGG